MPADDGVADRSRRPNPRSSSANARGLSSFEGKSAFGTWCHRVATTTCLDELRRQRRRPTTTTLTTPTGLTLNQSTMSTSPQVSSGVTCEPTFVKHLTRCPSNSPGRLFSRCPRVGVPRDRRSHRCGDGTVKSRISRGRALLAEQLRGNRNDDVERLTNGDNE